MKYQFTLTGLSPLIVHADKIEAADEVSKWQAAHKDTPRGDDRYPAWRWLTYVYHDGEHFAFPSANMMRCLIKAGTLKVLKGKKTYKQLVPASVVFDDEFLEFYGPKGKIPIEPFIEAKAKMNGSGGEDAFDEQKDLAEDHGFAIDMRRVTVQQSKHIRCRPFFREWKVVGHLEKISNDISDADLAELFNIAGSSVGIGVWRPSSPQSPGPFGRFTAEVKKV